jgi:hypothetical protein
MITDEELRRIVTEIFSHIKNYDLENDFNNWFAGITNNPSEKEKYLKKHTSVDCFKYWNLRDKSTAINVEEFLHWNGFKKNKSELTIKSALIKLFTNSTIVYVFKNE